MEYSKTVEDENRYDTRYTIRHEGFHLSISSRIRNRNLTPTYKTNRCRCNASFPDLPSHIAQHRRPIKATSTWRRCLAPSTWFGAAAIVSQPYTYFTRRRCRCMMHLARFGVACCVLTAATISFSQPAFMDQIPGRVPAPLASPPPKDRHTKSATASPPAPDLKHM